ncbi:hypothetical protein D3C72_1147610 [compost metagenome]
MNWLYFTSGWARTKTRSSRQSVVTSWAAQTSAGSFSTVVSCSAMKMLPDSWIVMYTGSLGLSVGDGGVAGGRSSLIDTVARGAATMKMISSTSMMSTNGVTLMSAFCSIVLPPWPAGPESLEPIRRRLHHSSHSPASSTQRYGSSLGVPRRACKAVLRDEFASSGNKIAKPAASHLRNDRIKPFETRLFVLSPAPASGSGRPGPGRP